MEKNEIIDQFSEFLRQKYYKELAKVVSKGQKSIQVDFSLLDKFNPSLADEIIEDPDNTIYYINESIKQFDFSDGTDVQVRFFNLPENTNIRIRNIMTQRATDQYHRIRPIVGIFL